MCGIQLHDSSATPLSTQLCSDAVCTIGMLDTFYFLMNRRIRL